MEECHKKGSTLLASCKDDPQLQMWSLFLVVVSLNGMERYKEAAEALAQLQMSDCPIRTLALQVGVELSLVEFRRGSG